MKKLLVLLVALFFTQSFAASPLESMKFSKLNVNDDTPLLIQADQIEYSEKKSVLIASGNVEIQDNQTTLLADKVEYDQKAKTIKAYGNLKIITQDQHTLFANSAEFSDNLNDAVVQKVMMRMSDDTRMIAFVGTRKAGEETTLRKVVFSPCKSCSKNPNGAPMWQLKADKVTHAKKTKDVVYRNAFMEIYGVPVFYFPYFKHPDPSVKRKSGILAPISGSVSTLGFVTGVPLYLVLDDDKDLTLTPVYTSKEGFFGHAQYRQNFGAGQFRFEFSGTRSRPTNVVGNQNVVQERKNRGHIFALGDFELPKPLFANKTMFGFDIMRASDQTYARRYGKLANISLENSNTLPSKVYFNDTGRNTNLSTRMFSFYGTRQNDDNKRIPYLIPAFDFEYNTDPGSFGQYFTVETNNRHVRRDIGTNSSRLSLDGAVTVPFVSPFGDEYSFAASVQSDSYFVNQNGARNTSANDNSYNVFRVLPRFSIDWRYPFLKIGKAISFIIEPLINFTATPDLNERKEGRIPNEDSQFEFDESNVLMQDRFSGRDRLDAGRRISAGINTEAHFPSGSRLAFFLGQSYFSSKKSALLRESGAHDHYSDYVGRFLADVSNNIQLTYRFRFDRMSFRHKQSIGSVNVGNDKHRIGVSYLFSEKDQGVSGNKNLNQLTVNGSTQFHKNWTATAGMIRNLGADSGALAYSAGLGWKNECTSMDLSYEKKYFRDRDVKPGTTVLLTITFKHLGSVKTQALSSVLDPGRPKTTEENKTEEDSSDSFLATS